MSNLSVSDPGASGEDDPLGLSEFTFVEGVPFIEEDLDWNPNEDNGPHTAYTIDVTYVWSSGRLQLPVADGSQISAVLTLTNPTALKVVDWGAERQNAKPTLPSPISSDPNLTLLTVKILVKAPRLMVDGTSRVYVVSGQYVYAMTTSFLPGTDDLDGAVLPSDTLDVSEAGVESEQFTSILLNSATVTSIPTAITLAPTTPGSDV